ncbi:glutamine synthetase family protein [Conexibacter arvalis]|uniref:Glutamine synthetase n=1 Tax=Conexibacter arvalis TaxID=912552 RepID=A0A840I9Q6_9ACTN|nr:glutamine synthetase family protein [Conexibacter arvalis]MBB4660660.1 glutamine synthetase [Conexibacter arvalis]
MTALQEMPGRLALDELEAAGIETVIVAAPDMQGRLFGRRMSPAQLRRRLDGIDLCTCTLAWDIDQSLELQVDYAGFHTGWQDMRLVPDPATLRRLGWLEGVALCFGDLRDDEGATVPIGPRAMLQGQIERLAQLGYEARIGSELEFYLYRGTPTEARAAGYRGLTPTTEHHADYLISPGNLMEPFFGRLRRGLEASGVELELEQGEWGLGQWEVNMRYGPPLEAADRHALFKLATKEVATLEGLCATFMARPSNEAIGSSGHVHLSLLDRDGGAAFHDGDGERGLSAAYRAAVGGVLDHAAEFMAWYAPTVNSYRRASRDELVAGAGATWGYDNRTTTVRTVGATPESLRLELRLPGADGNPYLVFAALLASVADGLERQLDPGPPVRGNAYEQERRPLPADLAAAAAALRGSAEARAAFGDVAVDHYAAVAEHEWEQFMAVVGEWEIARYFEQI